MKYPPSLLTPAEINALPARVRNYIIFIETAADPSGTIRNNIFLTETNLALQALIKEQDTMNTKLLSLPFFLAAVIILFIGAFTDSKSHRETQTHNVSQNSHYSVTTIKYDSVRNPAMMPYIKAIYILSAASALAGFLFVVFGNSPNANNE